MQPREAERLIKSFSVFFISSCYVSTPFVLDTPCAKWLLSPGKSSSGWQSISSTGVSPLRILRSHPHCLWRFYHARTVAGQEYHGPQCLSSPYREPPDTCSNFYRSTVIPPNADQKIISGVWSFRKRCHGAVLLWLMLFTIAMGKYLMNECLIFKEHNPFTV